MPIAIGISLVAGLIAVVDALVVYLRGQGIEASGISTEQLLSFLGAPILVCVAGAVAVVAMTANAFAEDIQASLDSGMNAHIAKPLVMEEVIKVISVNLN